MSAIEDEKENTLSVMMLHEWEANDESKESEE